MKPAPTPAPLSIRTSRAIAFFGSQSALARALSVSPPAVTKMKARGVLPPSKAAALVKAFPHLRALHEDNPTRRPSGRRPKPLSDA